jgi:hypothetical protein
VAFGCAGRLPVAEGEPVQASFTLEVNEWNGVCEPRLVLRRARPASEEPLQDAPGRGSDLQAPVVGVQEPAGARARRGRAEPQELALFAL